MSEHRAHPHLPVFTPLCLLSHSSFRPCRAASFPQRGGTHASCRGSCGVLTTEEMANFTTCFLHALPNGTITPKPRLSLHMSPSPPRYDLPQPHLTSFAVPKTCSVFPMVPEALPLPRMLSSTSLLPCSAKPV